MSKVQSGVCVLWQEHKESAKVKPYAKFCLLNFIISLLVQCSDRIQFLSVSFEGNFVAGRVCQSFTNFNENAPKS